MTMACPRTTSDDEAEIEISAGVGSLAFNNVKHGEKLGSSMIDGPTSTSTPRKLRLNPVPTVAPSRASCEAWIAYVAISAADAEPEAAARQSGRSGRGEI